MEIFKTVNFFFIQVTICNYNAFTTNYSVELLTNFNKQIPPAVDPLIAKWLPLFYVASLPDMEKKKLSHTMEVG